MRYLLHFTFVVILVLLVANIGLINYGIDQLKGQLKIINGTTTIAEALQSTELTDTEKQKLLLIEKIKNFASDSLGLNAAGNYTTFYNQHHKPVLWVLTACPAYELKSYQWKFPLIGYVSYKGFFVKGKAKHDYNFLKQQGYDVDLSPVSAWSTLGFFKDPALSNFLKRDEGRLAELIIHELTHATVYNKSSVDYNENLATFIGEKGALRFLAATYGDTSKQLTDYIHYKHDEELYGAHLISGSRILDSLYKNFTPAMNDSMKHDLKKQLITKLMQQLDTLPFYNQQLYKFDFKKNPLPNNTDFMINQTYRGLQLQFTKQLLEVNNDLQRFITLQKAKD
ncbi:MAG: aminopeptidase [Bacteroidia bacterium]